MNHKINIMTIMRCVVVAVLLISGIAKMIDNDYMISAMKHLYFIPDIIKTTISFLLPSLEIILGLMLLFKVKMQLATICVTIMFAGFFIYSLHGYYIKAEGDCGCFGGFIKSTFGIGMVIRNALLLAIMFYITYIYYRDNQNDKKTSKQGI